MQTELTSNPTAIVNAATMMALDQRTIQELGIPSLVLMERASLGVQAAIHQHFGQALQNVQVLCGTGNNGGDGLALTRLLHCQGIKVKVWLAGEDSKRSPENQQQLQILQQLAVPLAAIDITQLPTELKQASLLVDSLFGVGLSREISGDWKRIIEAINTQQAQGTPVVAIDLPSGLNADTGEVLGGAVKADLTVSCALPKWCHYLDPALAHVGQLEVADIGIPPHFYAEHPQRLLTPQHLPLPGKRAANSHKGSYGRLGIVAGSQGMSGAAQMAALAALQSGAGLVHLFVPASLQAMLAGQLPEVQVVGLPEAEGALSLNAWHLLKQQLRPMDALLIGPGLGRYPQTQALCQHLFGLPQPLLLDADALYHLAESEPPAFVQPPVLTPHPGELARLLGLKGADIQADRVQAAQAAQQKYQAVTVLKGARTLIASPQQLSFNPTGNPGMARGGMGDVLAGLTAGLLAQGLAPTAAAELGVYWHGLAGDLAAQQLSEVSLTVSRLLAFLPLAWQQLQRP